MFSSFTASMNFFGNKKHKGLRSEFSEDMTVSGAYRKSRDDSFGFNNSFATEQIQLQMRPTKSSNDLTTARNVPINLRQSSPEISQDPRGASQEDHRITAHNSKLFKQQQKEQKRLDKQLQVEQKAREKQTRIEQKKLEKEQARQEKIVKKTENRSGRQERKEENNVKRTKNNAPLPPTQPTASPVAHSSHQYQTNTLESSISRSSGPPPYSSVPRLEPDTKVRDATGNVVYRKPEDTGSWGMISKHRQQIKLTTVKEVDVKVKPTVMDLNYRGGSDQGTSNSDA